MTTFEDEWADDPAEATELEVAQAEVERLRAELAESAAHQAADAAALPPAIVDFEERLAAATSRDEAIKVVRERDAAVRAATAPPEPKRLESAELRAKLAEASSREEAFDLLQEQGLLTNAPRRGVL